MKFFRELETCKELLNICSRIHRLTAGSFLLARLTLNQVLGLTTTGQIRKTLQRKPQNLNEAFQESMQRIDAQSEARKTLARRLLSWITFARRQLTVAEVTCAFAVSEKELNEDEKPSIPLLLRVCVGLVVLNNNDNSFQLLHASAYEYFSLSFSNAAETHFDIARTSLNALCLESFNSQPCTSPLELIERLDSLSFIEYAAKYWGEHTLHGSNEELLEPLVMKLLNDDNLSANAFQILLFGRDYANSAAKDELFASLPVRQTKVHVAANWNLTRALRIFLRTGVDASPKDSHDWTPLHWACSNGNFLAAEILLENGASVNAQDMQGWTPLFWAAFIGKLDLVRLLLSKGASYGITSSLGWTALHWAISCGHFEIVKELLKHHSRAPDVNIGYAHMSMDEIRSFYKEPPPVVLAADYSSSQLFGLLVGHLETPGAEVSDKTFNGIWKRQRFDSPVSQNIWRSTRKSQRVATAKLAPTPDQDQMHCEVEWKSILLASAIRADQLSTVQLLLETGADANSYHAIHLAAYRKDPSYVNCLLERGADPTSVDNFGRTALHEAVMHGFVETTIALINGGCDVNKQVGPKCYTDYHIRVAQFELSPDVRHAYPLMQACGHFLSYDHRENHESLLRNMELSTQLVEALLLGGADPKMKDQRGRTALHYAILRPHLPLVKLLVENGCPIDAADASGRIPLHYLARCDESFVQPEDLEKIARLLVTYSEGKGATQPKLLNKSELITPDKTQEKCRDIPRTALHVAFTGARWKTVRVLLNIQADFPTTLEMNSTIELAIRDLKTDMVDLLVSHGALPPPNGVAVLIESVLARKKQPNRDHCQSSDTDLDIQFERILGTIIHLGADVNFDTTPSRRAYVSPWDPIGGSPLTLIARKPGSSKMIQILLSFGADPYSSSMETFDPILTAALLGNLDGLCCLLEFATKHPNPLHWSIHLGTFPEDMCPIMRVCSCLETAGVLAKLNSHGCTLLDLAIEEENDCLIHDLESKGCMIDAAQSKTTFAIQNPTLMLKGRTSVNLMLIQFDSLRRRKF